MINSFKFVKQVLYSRWNELKSCSYEKQEYQEIGGNSATPHQSGTTDGYE
jgi:hypothetical protein